MDAVSRRVIVGSAGLPEFVGLVEHARSEHGWEPCYWITTPHDEERIADTFPDAVRHPVRDSAMGVPPPECADLRTRPLDPDDLDRFAKYEVTADQLMDRMDPGDAFDPDERRRHYLRQLMYWLNVVDRFDPGLVLFKDTPHLISRFVLYAVCIEESIPTVMFQTTGLPSRIFVRGRIGDLPIGFEEAHARALEQVDEGRGGAGDAGPDDGDAPLPEDVEAHLRRIRGDYDEAEPTYMRAQRRAGTGPVTYLRKLVQVHRWPRYAAKVLGTLLGTRAAPHNYLKEPGKRPEDSEMSRLQLLLHRRRARSFKRDLRARYDRLAGPPVPGETYVYVALHYQPERTSVPEGGVFGDQRLMVNLVSHAVPDDWRVYVKEHPSQFLPKGQGHQGRTRRFYDDLRERDNVRLIDLDASSFDLIDGAEAVATLTGTTGWEAVVRGTPALVFGDAWYRACEGVFEVRTFEDCVRAVEEVQKGYAVDAERVRAFLAAMVETTHRGYLNPHGGRIAPFGAKENRARLAAALDAFVAVAGLSG